MQFIRLSLVVLFAICSPSHAEEAEGGAAKGGEAEGGGEGKAAKPPREQREYVDKNNKVSALASKIEEAKKRFKELIHEKEETKGADAKAPILKEMVEVANQRAKDEAEYQKLKTELQQRYPNRGTHVNRHAGVEGDEHGAEAKAAKVNEAPSLDDLLKETKALIDRKYATEDATGGGKDSRKPASAAEPLRPPRLKLEK